MDLKELIQSCLISILKWSLIGAAICLGIIVMITITPFLGPICGGMSIIILIAAIFSLVGTRNAI